MAEIIGYASVNHFCCFILLLFSCVVHADAGLPVVSIIIDDLGQDMLAARQVINLPGPVVSAVLPNTLHARQVAILANHHGKEVMLHQPMQSISDNKLGDGSIVLDMTRKQLRNTLKSNLEKIPFVVGVNNHMGSLITQHPGHMLWVMEYLKESGNLFFIDSRTTKETVAQQLASEIGVSNTRRNVFLDHEVSEEAILYQVRRMIRLAKRDGSAVAIGHPFPETIKVLQQEIPKFNAYGVRLVPIMNTIAMRQGDVFEKVEVAEGINGSGEKAKNHFTDSP